MKALMLLPFLLLPGCGIEMTYPPMDPALQADIAKYCTDKGLEFVVDSSWKVTCLSKRRRAGQ